MESNITRTKLYVPATETKTECWHCGTDQSPFFSVAGYLYCGGCYRAARQEAREEESRLFARRWREEP